MGVDITQELKKIENNPNGSVVKDAIYNALLKLANAEGGGSGITVGDAWFVLDGIKNTTVGNASFSEIAIDTQM